ncbi:MAG: GNAT family N-acetyltransferase [Myxococcales bacterium]
MAIEPLERRHDRRAFSCGEPSLDDWFRHRASQDARRDLAQVFVAIDEQLGLVGFYSLSAFALELEDLAQRLPRYDAIPAALIGRLAQDLRARGQGLGAVLMADAIGRVLDARERLGIFAIVVDALSEKAQGFYERFGFNPLPARPDRLFLLTSVAEQGRAGALRPRRAGPA